MQLLALSRLDTELLQHAEPHQIKFGTQYTQLTVALFVVTNEESRWACAAALFALVVGLAAHLEAARSVDALFAIVGWLVVFVLALVDIYTRVRYSAVTAHTAALGTLAVEAFDAVLVG